MIKHYATKKYTFSFYQIQLKIQAMNNGLICILYQTKVKNTYFSILQSLKYMYK